MKKILMALVLAVLAISCGNDTSSENSLNIAFKQEWLSDKEAIKGGDYKIGIVSSSPFKGIFEATLSNDATDTYFSAPLHPQIFYTDEDFQLINGGIADFEVDADNNTFTYKLREGLKWSDGEPITVDDIIYAYKIIGHKDYTGVRYNDSFRNIVGMEEYHEGKTNEIKGLERVSDTVLKVTFKEIPSGVLTGGSGLIGQLTPYHDLKDIPIKELEQNDKVRINVLSYGPWKIEQIVPGESVKYVPNEYYWNDADRPVLDTMIRKIIPPATVLSSIKSGEFDEYSSVPSEVIDQVRQLDNIELLGAPALSYSYFGYNLGKYENGKLVVNKDAKTADLNLRKALAYALNVDGMSEYIFKGLKFRANGIVPPVFSKYYDKNIGQYPYDPEKAKKLLEEAGYKDVDGDGIREGKDGKPFKLILATANGGETSEPTAQAMIQNWKEVGINVELMNGRLLDASSYFDVIQANEGFDIFTAGWSVGTALNTDVYSKESAFNFTRFYTEENEKLRLEINNKEFLKEPEKRVEAYKAWHKDYMENVLGYVPFLYSVTVNPVNKRVKRSDVYNGDVRPKYPTEVVEKEPYKATN